MPNQGTYRLPRENKRLAKPRQNLICGLAVTYISLNKVPKILPAWPQGYPECKPLRWQFRCLMCALNSQGHGCPVGGPETSEAPGSTPADFREAFRGPKAVPKRTVAFMIPEPDLWARRFHTSEPESMWGIA